MKLKNAVLSDCGYTCPCTIMKVHERVEVELHAFLTLALN
jgi:hypothetical protein